MRLSAFHCGMPCVIWWSADPDPRCRPSASAEVFINEIHYDNAGSATVGERVEVVATAGESLSGYRIYLYNGSTPSAATYYDNDLRARGQRGQLWRQRAHRDLGYAANGIQNGANDGIALANGSGTLVQFLSYEGAMTGSNGPAAGRASSNLPVSESEASAAGSSLQLGGSGSSYANFTWQASGTQTFGACNRNQTFPAPNPPPVVTSTTPVNGATGFPAAGDLAVGFSEVGDADQRRVRPAVQPVRRGRA